MAGSMIRPRTSHGLPRSEIRPAAPHSADASVMVRSSTPHAVSATLRAYGTSIRRSSRRQPPGHTATSRRHIMAVLTQHAPGTFSWPELATTDQDGAKKFYGALFGWTSKDFPMGPDAGVYTIFEKNGKDASALLTLNPEQIRMGLPPNWGAYITVADADAASEKAK